MHTKRNIYLSVLIIVTVLCVIIGATTHVVNHWNSSFGESYGNGGSRALTTEEMSLAGVKSMEIDLSVAELTVKEGTDASLVIRSSERLLPAYELSNGTLTMTQEKIVNLWRLGVSEKCKITITLPKDTVLTSAEISGNVGDLSFSDLSFETLSISTDVGSCSLKDINILEDVTLDSHVGEMKLDNVSFPTGAVELDVGDFDAKNIVFDELVIDSHTGDVDLAVASDVDLGDYEVTLDAEIGDVRFLGENVRHHYEQSGTNGRLMVTNDVGGITVK